MLAFRRRGTYNPANPKRRVSRFASHKMQGIVIPKIVDPARPKEPILMKKILVTVVLGVAALAAARNTAQPAQPAQGQPAAAATPPAQAQPAAAASQAPVIKDPAEYNAYVGGVLNYRRLRGGSFSFFVQAEWLPRPAVACAGCADWAVFRAAARAATPSTTVTRSFSSVLAPWVLRDRQFWESQSLASCVTQSDSPFFWGLPDYKYVFFGRQATSHLPSALLYKMQVPDGGTSHRFDSHEAPGARLEVF